MNIKELMKKPEFAFDKFESYEFLQKVEDQYGKSLVIMKIVAVSLVLTFVFLAIYRTVTTIPDVTVIAAAGSIISGVVTVVGFFAFLLTQGIHSTYVKIILLEKEAFIASCMFEMEIMYKIVDGVSKIAPKQLNSVLSQKDIERDLAAYPVIRERLAHQI
jgi:hypothetical protein